MRKALTPAALSLLLLAACSSGPLPSPSPSAVAADPARPLPSPLPEVVARVNGQPVRIQQILPWAKAELERVPVAERESRRPEALRAALERYVERELLLQEAIARGIQADTRAVDWDYDQARRGHPDPKEWSDFLAKQGTDPQTFRAELRAQHTVAALVELEVAAWPVKEDEARLAFELDPTAFAAPGAKSPPRFEEVKAQAEAAVRQHVRPQIQAALLGRLQAKARIERLL